MLKAGLLIIFCCIKLISASCSCFSAICNNLITWSILVSVSLSSEVCNWLAPEFKILEACLPKACKEELFSFSNYPLFLNKLKKSCSSRENFDYLNVISAINIALQGADNFKKNNDLEIQRIEQIIKNIQSQINLLKKESNLSENLIRERLSNSYIRHGGSYQKQYNQISEGVKKTLAGQRTEKIQKILEKILNEYKYKFIELGNGNFFNITDQDILNILH